MNDYQAKWQEFNKLRRQYFLALWAGAVALSLGAARDFSDAAMNTMSLNFIILIFVVFYFYAAFRISRWPCPRCKKAFLSSIEKCRSNFDFMRFMRLSQELKRRAPIPDLR